MFLQRIRHRFKRWWNQQTFSLWYDPAYRLPITSLEHRLQLEPRRADYTLWYLLDTQAISDKQVYQPSPIALRDLARVHKCSYLESLNNPETLANMFAVDTWDIPKEPLLQAIRLACGGTLQGARFALQHQGIAFNLLGGFHHASPHRGGPLCPVHDIAIAIAALRADGFDKKIVVLDFDAHPPDGTEDCLANDPNIWMGSLSGTDWGPLPHTDETVLPSGCNDTLYLQHLSGLLQRMPKPDLAFVIAGGDVLANDHMGGLGLTLRGARERDALVYEALFDVPSVWLPGGGYHKDAWKILAGTGLILSLNSKQPIPVDYLPLAMQYHKISRQFDPSSLDGEESFLTEQDFSELFGIPSQHHSKLFLGYYTPYSIEYSLFRYGILDTIRRLGYDPLTIKIDTANEGDRFRLFGQSGEKEHILVELVAEKRHIVGELMLYVHWLNLRNPKASFSENRPKLPGQDTPGLGLALEASELLKLMAQRLHLAGVALQPAWFHIAFALRRQFQFVDPTRQGRFLALIRDLSHISLLEATLAIDQGRVLCNEQPYSWESGIMASWLTPISPETQEAIDKAQQQTNFRLVFAQTPSETTFEPNKNQTNP